MHEVELKLFNAKLADKRVDRKAAYLKYLEEQNVKGMLGASFVAAGLFKIGIDSFGDISHIYREIIRDSWRGVEYREIKSKAFVDKTEGDLFVVSERDLIIREIHKVISDMKISVPPNIFNSARELLFISSDVHRHRFPVLIDALWKNKQNEYFKEKREHSRWKIERSLQLLSLVILLFTAYVGWSTYSSSRMEFHLRNRPYLSIRPLSMPQMLSEVSGPGNIEIQMTIQNNGEIPALDAVYYSLALADGELLYGVNAKNISTQGKDIHVEFMHSDNNVIFPKLQGEYDFSMPKPAFMRLLKAVDKEKSGITFKVDYCGPWGNPKEQQRQYSTEVTILPWLDGRKIKYKVNAEVIQ